MSSPSLKSTAPVKSVSSPADIDTGSHAVIEASAGTGKTYTISGLVMRLVGEEEVSISRVLVVTFTEKATGELRQRIRDDMLKALETGSFQWSRKFGDRGPAGWEARFRQAVDCFQDARIFTIHGFCRRTLNEYALEADSTLDLEMTDDREVFERCMNRLKRRWALDPYITEKFEVSGYSAGAWDQTLMALAGRYHPDFTLLEPEPLSDESIQKRFERILEIVDPDPDAEVENQPFYILYSGLQFHLRSKKPLLEKVVTPMLECLRGWRQENYLSPLHCIADIYRQCKELNASRFKSHGFRCLLPDKWNKGADTSSEPVLKELADILHELSGQVHSFLLHAVTELYREATLWKDTRGLMSFNDMISRLYDGLDPELNSNARALLSELRSAYRFCLVDEAQDTDPVQAAIFKRIFLDDSKDSGCRLFVIGDPKQAIYGFRGADVNAYLSMKSDMTGRGAQLYSLPVNFRTLPMLTRTMNRLFEGSHWFPGIDSDERDRDGQSTDITFMPSLSQDEFQQDFRVESGPRVLLDPFGGDALQYLTMHADRGTSASELRTGFGARIASTIRRLLDNPMRFVLKGIMRTLKPSDICVLVRGRKELKPLSDALRRKNIAFSFYRQAGLYQSPQAFHMRLMLDAAARPADTAALTAAMLTPFFNLTPEETMEGHQAHAARDMILQASDLAILRRWPAFFQLLLEETGVLEHFAHEGDERAQANLVQISWELQQDAITGSMDIHTLLRHLDSLRDESGSTGMGGGLHMLETERDTVQIMTMHASKGLEFPVVFLYGGFTSGNPREKYHTWYDAARHRRVYDISKSNSRRHRAELDSEDKRLYYVACTRAVFRLFIPRVEGEPSWWLNGPMLRLVGKAIEHMEASRAEESRAEAVGIAEQVPHGTDAMPEPGEQVHGAVAPDMKIAPHPPEIPHLEGRRINIHSYSSMISSAAASPETPASETGSSPSGPADSDGQGPFFGVMFNDQEEALRDESILVLPDIPEPEPVSRLMYPSDMETDALSDHRETVFQLPPGAETGNLLHDILEHIDYTAVSLCKGPDALLSPGASTALCIQDALSRHRIRECAPSGKDGLPGPAELAVARMIFNTLRTPVPGLGIELASINTQNRRHELEFHVALPGGSFVTGFIDLLFRVGEQGTHGAGKYYILDWKSTTIPGGYSPEQIELAMDEHDYHLQYNLYAWAVRRWFAMSRIDAESLAGVYYIFTRGMDPACPGNGVYFKEFLPEDAEAAETMVKQALGNAEVTLR